MLPTYAALQPNIFLGLWGNIFVIRTAGWACSIIRKFFLEMNLHY